MPVATLSIRDRGRVEVDGGHTIRAGRIEVTGVEAVAAAEFKHCCAGFNRE